MKNQDNFYIGKAGEVYIRREGQDILCADQELAKELIVANLCKIEKERCNKNVGSTDHPIYAVPRREYTIPEPDSFHPFPSEQYEVEVKKQGICCTPLAPNINHHGNCDECTGYTEREVAVIIPRKKEEPDDEKTTVLKDLEALADKNGYSAALLNASDDIVALTFELEQAELKIEKLQAFKDYVHNRLDKMGIPSDPEPENNLAHGCRIEGRINALTPQFQSEPVLNAGKGEKRGWKSLEQARGEALEHAEKVIDGMKAKISNLEKTQLENETEIAGWFAHCCELNEKIEKLESQISTSLPLK